MCGISGIIGSNDRDTLSIINNMNLSLKHRGPDAKGSYKGKNFIFGHTRLSILDISSDGNQPMEFIDRYVITYNGEIYNYIELREELENLGCKFKSNTDTEVIIAAYHKFGSDALKKFNGMWAFVIYDKVKNNFFISRDRLGIKPLFFSITDNKFVFASEIKALYKIPYLKKKPNFEYLRSYLKNGPQEYIAETAFQGIYKFPAASFLEGDIKTLIFYKTKKFWHLKHNNKPAKFKMDKAHQYAKKYYELLKDAVRIRLRSDVKVALALSGGIDSSSIVYLANLIISNENNHEKMETFSNVFNSRNTEYCDESFYINKLVKKLNLKSNTIEPFEKDVRKEYKQVLTALENPHDSTLFSVWSTYKLISSKGFKVTLEGQGADELLAGYHNHISRYLADLNILEFIFEGLLLLRVPDSRRYIFKVFPFILIRYILGLKITNKLLLFLEREPNTGLNHYLVNDINTRLVNLLNYSDRLAMAHSLESRMPFLDYRLLEFIANIPSVYKIHNGWTKYIARLAFDKKLPDEICWRKDKMGWPCPEELWFNGDLKNWLINNVQDSNILKILNINFSKKNTLKTKIRFLNISIFEKLFFKKL